MRHFGQSVDALTPSQHRALAALFAATLGVLICLGQQHFHLSLAHPHTFLAAAHHRCALCLYATFAWLLFETSNLSTLPLREASR